MPKSNSQITLNLGDDKVIRFKFEEFEDNLDIDKIIQIDYANLVAEMITFPVVVNKLGLLAADASANFRLAKFNLKLMESKLRRQSRLELMEEKSGKNPTVQEIEDRMQTKKLFKVRSQEMNEAEKVKDYLDSIYEAARDKSRKLDKLSLTLQVGDIDESIIQKQLNNVYFKIKKGKL